MTEVSYRGDHRWEAELQRLKGEILLAQSVQYHAEADTRFVKLSTLPAASRQSRLSYERRVSLSRLWQH